MNELTHPDYQHVCISGISLLHVPFIPSINPLIRTSTYPFIVHLPSWVPCKLVRTWLVPYPQRKRNSRRKLRGTTRLCKRLQQECGLGLPPIELLYTSQLLLRNILSIWRYQKKCKGTGDWLASQDQKQRIGIGRAACVPKQSQTLAFIRALFHVSDGTDLQAMRRGDRCIAEEFFRKLQESSEKIGCPALAWFGSFKGWNVLVLEMT